MSRDYVKYFCEKSKRHIWTLGYFGGGSINFEKIKIEVEKFQNETGVDLKSIFIDEIIESRRFKGFKFLFSIDDNQKPLKDSMILGDVMEYLTD